MKRGHITTAKEITPEESKLNKLASYFSYPIKYFLGINENYADNQGQLSLGLER